MAKQTAMIYLSLKKGIGTFERILILLDLERRQYVIFFKFRQARNCCRADRTLINLSSKIQLEFLIKENSF